MCTYGTIMSVLIPTMIGKHHLKLDMPGEFSNKVLQKCLTTTRLFFISSANSKLFIVFLQSHNSLEIPVNRLSKKCEVTIFLKLLITPYSFGVAWFLTCLLWNSAPLLDNGGTDKARWLASRQSISVLWRQAVMAFLLTHANSPAMLCQLVLFCLF